MRSKLTCVYPGAAFKFEYVASVARTAPDELRTWTFMVSLALVVVVSAVSMCRQNERVALAAVDGMLTACKSESVCAEP